jgi:hypothetical protein
MISSSHFLNFWAPFLHGTVSRTFIAGSFLRTPFFHWKFDLNIFVIVTCGPGIVNDEFPDGTRNLTCTAFLPKIEITPHYRSRGRFKEKS